MEQKKNKLSIDSTLILTAFFASLAVVVAGIVCFILFK